MIQLDVIQGENSWHEARAKYRRTASLAPAIMGSSKKKSRTEAITYLTTGMEKEFSQWVRDNLLDRGHLIESFAKPMAEKIIGKKLYPITAISDDEYLLASYDGLSADDEDAWECKSWNEKKAEDVRAGIVPDEDLWQVVQQLAIGAKRCMYMVTDGTEERTEYCWLLREEVTEEIERLIAGWNQADKDVADYQPQEYIPAAAAAPIKDLPAVMFTVSGELAIKTNFGAWGIELRNFIALIPEKPATDQEFADCKAAVAAFKKAEAQLDAEESRVLSLVPDIDEMKREKKLLRDLSSTTRLALEKMVVRRDIEVKAEIMQVGKDALAAHIAKLNIRLDGVQMPPIDADWAVAIKSKRNLENMRDAVADLVAASKIKANETADRIDANLKTIAAAGHEHLFGDIATLSIKAPGDLAAAIRIRLDDEAKRIESQRAAIQAEEEAKAKAAQEALLAAERVKMEAAVKAKAEQQAIADAEQRAHEKALAGEPYVLQPAEAAQNNPPQSQAGTLAGVQPEPAAPAAKPSNVVVIEHQAEISAFLASRDFGKEAGKVRAILVEFVKFSEQFNSKKAA